LELPPPKIPRNGTIDLPYVFVGDEAFALRQDFLKPFSQKNLNTERIIFNYRLSRARRIVENVLGILASRFRIFHTEINLRLDSIETIVLACVLHNFLRRRSKTDSLAQEKPSASEELEVGQNVFIPLKN
jgi:hypothetical protein